MSSMKELLLLRIEGAIDAPEESYRESRPGVFMPSVCAGIGRGDFSVIAIDPGAEGAEPFEDPCLPALK